MKQFLIHLIQIGNQNDYSGAKQRSIQLTNVLALAGMFGALGFAALFFAIDPTKMLPPALIGLSTLFLLLFVFVFNKQKHYELATIWLLLAISVPVFINLRVYLGFRSGYHIFFILYSLLPVLLFAQKKWFWVVILAGMNLAFFFFTYRYIPPDALVADVSKTLLTNIENLTAFFVLVSIVAIFWFNHRISDSFEKDLVDKKKNLESLLMEMRKFSSLDALTDILNRGHMEQRINEELTRGYRYGFPISLVMYDLDHFKNVNDLHGHDVGDIVLKQTASMVKSSIRETDALGRWGGEEFMILLPYTNESIADKIAKKLCKVIEDSDFGEYGHITASFGVVQWDGIENFEHLYKRIDRALYAAKERGRNQVVTETLLHDAKQTEVKYFWKSEWESGHMEIDRQHRRLVESLATFLNGEDKTGAADFVDLLALDLTAHFEYEETLLSKIGYAEAEHHKTSHKKLVRWLKNMRNEITVGQGEFNQHSVHVLAETVVNHMLEEDVKYYPSLRK